MGERENEEQERAECKLACQCPSQQKLSAMANLANTKPTLDAGGNEEQLAVGASIANAVP